MGIGIRIHFFHDDGTIKRIPHARFERLMSEASIECFPKYAKMNVRCAMTYVELKQRIPIKIMKTDFIIIPFTETGKLDSEEYFRGDLLAVNMADLPLFSRPDNVVEISSRIARKRYLQEFTWKPTNMELDLLVNDIFPRKRV
jgi:hypothetical protein